VPKIHPVTKKTARVSYVLVSLSGRVRYGVHRSCVKNLLRGLTERVFAVERNGKLAKPPTAKPGAFQRLDWIAKRVGCGIRHVPIEARAFAALYTGKRRTVYDKAVDSLELTSVCQDDSELKTFVKCEKINFTEKPDPAPRVIQPRHPRYNVEVGRFLKTLEGRLMKRVGKLVRKQGKGVGPAVAKGLNASDLGALIAAKWDSFADPVAVGCDASRFDQHVGVQALEWEHSVYLNAVDPAHRPELARLLKWQLLNKGIAFADDGVIKYSVSGNRMSGDMNTGMGNCLIMCGMVIGYFDSINLCRYDLINNGDDCVIIVERSDLQKIDGFVSYCLDLGFTMVMEAPVYELEKIEFCQMKPVATETSYKMVRNHLTVFSKDCVTTHNLADKGTYSAYCHAIGRCGLALAGDIPCQGAFYNALAGVGKPTKLKVGDGLGWWSKGMDSGGYVVPCVRSRVSYWKAFGVTPDEQLAIERHYATSDLTWVNPIDTDLCQGFVHSCNLL
jgi:hypothetical protein